MKISIIVPCYNQAEYLPETLDSVLAQTYSDWECIIVNDGSPDNTHQIASQYCSRDNRFIYINKQNGGLSSARNVGIEAAKGEYLLFLDSDDILLESKLLSTVECLRLQPNLEVIHSNYVYCQGKNRSDQTRSSLRVELKSRNKFNEILLDWECGLSIPIHCVAWSAELIQKHNIRFNTSFPAKEDWDFHLSVFEVAKNYRYTNQVGCIYRRHTVSMSNDDKKMVQGTYLTLLNHLKYPHTFAVLWKGSEIFNLNLYLKLRMGDKQFREFFHLKPPQSFKLRSILLCVGVLLLTPIAAGYKIFTKLVNILLQRTKSQNNIDYLKYEK